MLTKPYTSLNTQLPHKMRFKKKLFFIEISVAVSIILLTPGCAVYGKWIAEPLLKAITGSL